MTKFLVVILAGLWCVGAVSNPTLAQDRSDTGRHRPEPKPEPTVAETDETIQRETPWFFGVGAGVLAGSDLFRAETVNGFPVPWDPETGGGFTSARFRAEMDGSAAMNLYLGRQLGSWLALRGDLAVSRMDVSAEAKIGQQGGVFRFDTFTVTSFTVGAEARLVRRPSHPFLGMGLTIVHLGPSRADALAQTNLGAQLALGWLQRFNDRWSVRLEGRISRSGFSMGDYLPQADLDNQPELIVDAAGSITLSGILLTIQNSF